MHYLTFAFNHYQSVQDILKDLNYDQDGTDLNAILKYLEKFYKYEVVNLNFTSYRNLQENQISFVNSLIRDRLETNIIIGNYDNHLDIILKSDYDTMVNLMHSFRLMHSLEGLIFIPYKENIDKISWKNLTNNKYG
jgi:hypothetical protein